MRWASERRRQLCIRTTLRRIQLGDVMMRRVSQPERMPVMHQPVHPILAELDQEEDERNLQLSLRFYF